MTRGYSYAEAQDVLLDGAAPDDDDYPEPPPAPDGWRDGFPPHMTNHEVDDLVAMMRRTRCVACAASVLTWRPCHCGSATLIVWRCERCERVEEVRL